MADELTTNRLQSSQTEMPKANVQYRVNKKNGCRDRSTKPAGRINWRAAFSVATKKGGNAPGVQKVIFCSTSAILPSSVLRISSTTAATTAEFDVLNSLPLASFKATTELSESAPTWKV